jgi:hypothetical protein
VKTDVKERFLAELSRAFGAVRKLPGSQSLLELGNSRVRVYVRYSKLHPGGRTFFGLRRSDLTQLEGHPALICFLWDGQAEPLMVPFHEYEEVFRVVSPASDGQYKVQVHLGDEGTELYIARAGRFGVEGHFGWAALAQMVDRSQLVQIPDLSHSQVQTLLGSIGATKGFDVWIPPSDRSSLDWGLANGFDPRDALPAGYDSIKGIIQEIDVIWVGRGSSQPLAFFEVEHSTPIYSALLRFNDVHLTAPSLGARFSVVANDQRHALFVRQLARPTFQASGLGALCTFFEYADVFAWYRRLRPSTAA